MDRIEWDSACMALDDLRGFVWRDTHGDLVKIVAKAARLSFQVDYLTEPLNSVKSRSDKWMAAGYNAINVYAAENE